MGHSGQEDLVQVAEHVRERLALLGWRGRQAGADLARLHLGEDRKLPDTFEVARGPFQRRSAVLAKGHFCNFSISDHVRVFSTCSFVSHARRA